jgi:hypothetical protein
MGSVSLEESPASKGVTRKKRRDECLVALRKR